jgi:hypothetical protein
MRWPRSGASAWACSPTSCPGGARGAGAERWRLYRALGELLETIAAGRPLALLVDDAHWADPTTIELLEHLIRRPPTDSLLLAVGLRSGPAAERLLAAQPPAKPSAWSRWTCGRSIGRPPRS